MKINFAFTVNNKRKLADSTISLACSSISTFWEYYSGSLDATEANVEMLQLEIYVTF